MHPETPQQGVTLEELFTGRSINIQQMKAHLAGVAKDLGLPFGDRQKTYNSRLAQELGKYAEQQGRGDEFHKAVFKAYFADGLNIGLVQTLIQIAASMGMSVEEVKETLEKRKFKEAVDKDWVRSYQKGVTAVPTFMINGISLVGAQPYEKLFQLMEAGGVERRV